MDTVVEYFGVAVKYGIPRLRDKCCEFASTVLCFDTAMDRFFSANDECLLDLFRAVCGEYANKHITTGTVKGSSYAVKTITFNF